MKIRTVGVLSLFGLTMFVSPVWAGPVGMQRSLAPDQRTGALAQLEMAQEQVGRQMPEPPKGPSLARYMNKRAQLQDLINRLQSGQPVSPDEIDQALQPTHP
jgi:hypothetical protein